MVSPYDPEPKKILRDAFRRTDNTTLEQYAETYRNHKESGPIIRTVNEALFSDVINTSREAFEELQRRRRA